MQIQVKVQESQNFQCKQNFKFWRCDCSLQIMLRWDHMISFIL